MPSAAALGHFERRMIEMGCPVRWAREKVRELADHYEDLKQAALETGLAEAEAGAWAEARLGDPVMLAENIVDGLRRSSWWGRHPIVGFCVAPFFGFALVWGGCAWALVQINEWGARCFGSAYGMDEKTLSALAGNVDAFEDFFDPFNLALVAFSLIVLTVGLGWLARRSAVGLRWRLGACAALLTACWVTTFSVRPHNVTVYMGWHSPYWPFLGIPAAAAGLAVWRQRWLVAGLAPIPRERRQKPAVEQAKPARLGRILATPTYWIAAALSVYIAVGATALLVPYFRQQSHRAKLRKTVWPAERAATLAHLAARQQAEAAGLDRPIDLKPWLNASLLDSTDGIDGVTNNNLAGLPAGLHTFAGVPFNVTGRMQLAGRELIDEGRRYPERIRHIVVNQKCARIHLLHGASSVHSSDQKIAALVLHYADGTWAEVGIVSGADVLDWWGPIYKTEAGDRCKTTSPGTELAWAGGNPWIALRAPDDSLRLYRSTFANPHPERKIASIDYDSTLTEAAPFLAGLTVEPSTN